MEQLIGARDVDLKKRTALSLGDGERAQLEREFLTWLRTR
jgi:hypothetical protein